MEPICLTEEEVAVQEEGLNMQRGLDLAVETLMAAVNERSMECASYRRKFWDDLAKKYGLDIENNVYRTVFLDGKYYIEYVGKAGETPAPARMGEGKAAN